MNSISDQKYVKHFTREHSHSVSIYDYPQKTISVFALPIQCRQNVNFVNTGIITFFQGEAA
jgi:hypothetical protein